MCDDKRRNAYDEPEAAHLVRPEGEKSDCVRAGGNERGVMPDDGGPRLFENILSVRIAEVLCLRLSASLLKMADPRCREIRAAKAIL